MTKFRRISRPCYDKAHRCPGWAGGGMKYAKVKRCNGGYITFGMTREELDALPNDSDVWKSYPRPFAIGVCTDCDVLVLPRLVRYIDLTPSNLRYLPRRIWMSSPLTRFRWWVEEKQLDFYQWRQSR